MNEWRWRDGSTNEWLNEDEWMDEDESGELSRGSDAIIIWQTEMFTKKIK